MTTEVREFDAGLLSMLLREGVLFATAPDTVFIGLGALRFQSESDTSQPTFYAPDFFLSSGAPWVTADHVYQVTRSSLIEALEAIVDDGPSILPLEWREPDFHSFKRRFLQVQREIRLGRWQKAVPVVFETSESPLVAAHIAQMLLGALRTKAPLTAFGVWNETSGIIGASPELLVSADGSGVVEVAALAGTVSRPLDGGEDVVREAFLADPKERTEHQLVVDFLRDVLQTLGAPEVGETTIQVLPRLLHLYTLLSVRTSRALDLAALAKLLHPSPALGVMPRHLGWEWFRDLDRELPRERFGAPFGIQLPGGVSKACVAIRAIQWGLRGAQGIRITLGAGCGIVADSNLEREWEELAAKRDSVHHLLGL